MDSKSAQAYLINPLNEPEPSAECGPGSSFARPAAPASVVASSSNSTNPYRRNSTQTTGASSHVRQGSREVGSPLFGSPGGSPRTDKFPRYREEALGGLNDSPPPRRSQDGARHPPSYEDVTGGRRRGSSLRERFPGDHSHQPLDIIRKDSKKANRSPHLQRRHLPGADAIDRLDPTVNKVPYHHEGPYDAALLARNTDIKHSPVAALKDSNEEALRATAGENVRDALENHRPLDGVAVVPSGEPDQFGRVRNYEEGTNELLGVGSIGGEYKKYDGVDYHPDDVRGQGEPSFSLDRALRNHTIHERSFNGERGIELSDRPLMGNQIDRRDPVEIAGDEGRYSDLQHAADVDAHPIGRKGSLREGIKRRIGSIRKRHDD